MEEGKLYRQLRKERGYTIAQVADEQNSRSFISKFEQGASSISIHRLERLLENIHVTVEEFYYLRAQQKGIKSHDNLMSFPSYMTSEFMDLLDRILGINKEAFLSNAHAQRSKEGLEEMRSELIAASKQHSFVFLYLEITKEIHEINLSGPKPNHSSSDYMEKLRTKTRPVISYLTKVDNWGVYEILLFRYFQFLFPVETSYHLLQIAISRTKKEQGLSLMREIQMDLIFSCFTTFVNFRRLEWAKEVLTIAEELLADRGDMLNSTHLLCYQGWYWYIYGDQEKGLLKIDQGLSIFRVLKQTKMVNLWERSLHSIKKNAEEPNSYLMFR